MSGNLTGVAPNPVHPAPVHPAPVQPGPGARNLGIRRRPRVDYFQWKVQALQQLGLQSKVTAQTAVATNVATTKASLFPQAGANAAATLTGTLGHPADPLFGTYLNALTALERDPTKADATRQALKAAADAFLARRKPLGAQRDPLSTNRDAACRQTLADLRRHDLCGEVTALGGPPWDSAKAMQVASLKASLDFESLPVGQQTASLNGQAGVTTSLWINQAANAGAKQKTFIFKPQMEDEVNGFPPGGEPVREAMVGRAADLLKGLGFGIEMPETHVIALSSDRLPPESAGTITSKAMQKAGPMIGSLQSFSAAAGDMKQASRDTIRSIPTEMTQNIAVMDIISLNCDRHGGNLLATGGNPPSIVPIDHGLSFPPLDQLSQLREKMSGNHNILLSMPGSHKPFDPAVLAKIAALDPDVFAGALQNELTTLGTAQPALAGTLDTTAVDVSRRSMQFLKRAAPTLTPAAIQIAIGRNAEALFDPALSQAEFEALADSIILKTGPEQAAIAEYYQMTVEQKGVVFKRLKDNGWSEMGFMTTDGPLMNDMTAIMALYHGNVQKLPARPQPAPPQVKVTQQRLSQITTLFPGTGVRSPEQQQTALAAFARFEALGMSAVDMKNFLRESGAHPLDAPRTLADVVAFMKHHDTIAALRTVVTMTPPANVRQALQAKLDYLDRLIPVLPANADPQIAQDAGTVRGILQATVRNPGDRRLSDWNERLGGVIDQAYDSVRARLHRITDALSVSGRIDDKAKANNHMYVDEGNLLSVFTDLQRADPALAGL